MLEVRAIRKYHDDKGILLGYTVQDTATGQTMTVRKEALKEAIASGKCNCVNMTMTSDGRLIGKAAPAPKKKPAPMQVVQAKKTLLQVFTCGKDIICGMVDVSVHSINGGVPEVLIPELQGMKPNTTVCLGNVIINSLNNGAYKNIVKDAEGKVDFKASNVSKSSFSKVRPRFIKIIEANNVKSKLSVKKVGKADFAVFIDNYETLANANLETIINIYKSLIVYAIKNGTKFRVESIEKDSVVFTGPDTVTDAKTVLKLVTTTK